MLNLPNAEMIVKRYLFLSIKIMESDELIFDDSIFLVSSSDEEDTLDAANEKLISEQCAIIENYLSGLSTIYLMTCIEMLFLMSEEKNLNRLLHLKRTFAMHAATTPNLSLARDAYKSLVRLFGITDEPVITISSDLISTVWRINKIRSLDMKNISIRHAVRTLLVL